MAFATSSKQKATDAAGEPQWGLWTAFVTAWVVPATTARRTQHLPLHRAFLAHLLAAALSLILIVILTISADPYATYARYVSHVSTELLEAFDFLVLDLQRDPSGKGLSLLVHCLSIELVFLALAVLIMPWGARDERIGATYRHALRRVWLQSTHAIPILLLVGYVAFVLVSAESAWWREHGVPSWSLGDPMAPDLTPGDLGYADAQRKYEAELRQYERKYLKHRQEIAAWSRTVPWFVGPPPGMIPSVALLASLWGLWALVRALGADRAVLPLERAPTCERCGYSLAGMPMEGRCPECGEPVVESLGPDARSGTIWQRRAEVGRLQAWRQCFLGTLLRPRRFGRQLRLVSPKTDYRNFFALHLPLIFCFAAAGFLAWGLVTTMIERDPWSPELFLITASVIFGCFSVIGAVLLTGLAALLGSAWHGFRGRRNLMPGAIQVACYLSGYLTLCYVFAVGSASAVEALHGDGFYADSGRILRIDVSALAFYSWVLPNMLCLIVYFVLVLRGTAATRYANR